MAFRRSIRISRGLLNKLRSARSSIAHRGHCDPPFDKNTTADLLTVALFGYRYLDMIKGAVLP
jgi:hypothetical protein